MQGTVRRARIGRRERRLPVIGVRAVPILIAVLILSLTTGFARIGETALQFVARYVARFWRALPIYLSLSFTTATDAFSKRQQRA
jgi:hypothetical protein